MVTIVIVLLGLEVLGLLKKIPGLSVLSGHMKRGTAIILIAILLIFAYGGVSLSGIMSGGGTGGGISLPGLPGEAQSATIGDSNSGELEFFPGGAASGAYTGSGLVYVLDSSFIKSSEEESRTNFMKILADGNTGMLLAPGGQAQAISISVSSGEFSKTQLTAKVGDHVALAGYLDNTPAAAENVSFVNDVYLSGFNKETAKWVWNFANTGTTDYTWRNYATTAWYDSTETARTGYIENETVAIEKSFSLVTFPTNNGEMIKDASLYLEAPSSNAGAIKKVKITGPSGKSVEYTSLQSTGQMSSSDPRFIAAPSLTTSTDTMYFIGAFPEDAVRTSNSQKAKYTVEMTYDHPATTSVLMYLKAVQNANAKTVSGGHFDFGTTMTVNMSTGSGADLWS